MMAMSTTASTTMAVRKTALNSALIKKHIAMLKISISGARTAMRRIICQAFCRLVTSVVMRVTRPAVLYLSMFEKEKACTLA